VNDAADSHTMTMSTGVSWILPGKLGASCFQINAGG